VGLDAILSVKGFAGEKGLESYLEIRVVNLGSQVDAVALAERARTEGADAVLVSQVVTQRDAHLHHVREVADAIAATYGEATAPVIVAGGPRFDPTAIAELGIDRVFGKGTTPREVASYLVHAIPVPARRTA
jgi:beta-lysine 5,6-aminomutase beta subunit